MLKYSDHRRATETKVVSQVFNTPELLDLILQQLDYGEKNVLAAVKLTCKGFKSSFDASPTLQKRTEFAIFGTAPLPPVGPRRKYSKRQLRRRTKAMEAEDDVHEAARRKYYLSRCNVHVQGLSWVDSSLSNPTTNVFAFNSWRTTSGLGAFERYRASTTFRNLRVCNEPLQGLRWLFEKPCGTSPVEHIVQVAEGEELTFGRLLDEVARHSTEMINWGIMGFDIDNFSLLFELI